VYYVEIGRREASMSKIIDASMSIDIIDASTA
jgi:hypothetical protein